MADSAFRPLDGEPDPFGPHPLGRNYSTTAELLLAEFATEADLAERVIERLEPWFWVEREVVGQHCSGRSLRVDAVIRPRNSENWRNPTVAFGLEFKKPDAFKVCGLTLHG